MTLYVDVPTLETKLIIENKWDLRMREWDREGAMRRRRREGARGGRERGKREEGNGIPWFCCCSVPLRISIQIQMLAFLLLLPRIHQRERERESSMCVCVKCECMLSFSLLLGISDAILGGSISNLPSLSPAVSFCLSPSLFQFLF